MQHCTHGNMLSVLVTAVAISTTAIATEPDGTDIGYQMPDQAITNIIDAPLTPQVSLSPDRKQMLILTRQSLPGIAELAEPELKLAGYRIKPANFGPSREWTAVGMKLQPVKAGAEARVVSGLPDNARLGNARWSPDGTTIAFTNTTADEIQLWVADVRSAKARRLTDRPLNMSGDEAPVWMPDSKSVLALFRLKNEGDVPQRNAAPSGPTIQQNLGESRPARTYQDLLTDKHDEALFTYFFTGRLARVALNGELTVIGEAGIFDEFDPSPDGSRILVDQIHPPFSYTVPASRFPYSISLYSPQGKKLKELVRKPLQDQIPLAFGSTETGPRSYGWRVDAPATLVWAEAQDGGDAGAEVEIRDHVMLQNLNSNEAPQKLAALKQRYGGTNWGTGKVALVTSWWWQTRNVRVWQTAPDNPDVAAKLVKEYSWQDRYNDPGNPVMKPNAAGRWVLQISADGEDIFMIGDGASDEGDRPFLDRVSIATGEATRLFRSEAPYYERPVTLLDQEGSRILTRREAVETPPNYYIRDDDSGDLDQITAFPHPTPQLKGIEKELVRYERADGIKLTGTLYTPAGYDPNTDGPLPTLLWAYPTEFKSADAAGQVTDSPYRFVRVGWWSPLVWLTQGYAVLDDPTMPIIGEGDEEPNDTYVAQLVSSAQAAVDMLVERGVGDREKMAIGGHSYGAFMTANLLAHSDIFAAGIARSGAYNRTLTPFGFQAEERTFWEAPEIYFAMSPFMHANDINEPMLMIHGQMDNNSGTFPVQSERMFDAMKALGGTVRMVMLPYESHGYRARESILHTMWETQRWLERYVR